MRCLKIFTVWITVFFFSCAGDNQGKEKETVKSERYSPERVIDKVVCEQDTTQSYAMYLPVGYSENKKYPVVYVFDPHASGVLPVTLYKALADKYGYILIGSNDSRNGNSWEESQVIANTLFADVSNKVSVDAQRVYLLGFSGGARVANTLTITNGAINSVICCGAAAPMANTTNPRNNYCFLGVVGNEDFNYVELKRYDMVDLAGHNVKHSMITFNGKHEWPPQVVMDEAFWWLELNEMRRSGLYKKDSLIAEHIDPMLELLESYYKNKEVVKTFHQCRKIINFYDGLTDLTRCYEIYKSIQNHPLVDENLKLEEKIWSEEDKLKRAYIQAFQTRNYEWWKKDVMELKQKIKTEKDTNKAFLYKRVLNFLSLASYMQTSGALKQNVLPAADFFSKIYILVDPENADAHYFIASIAAQKGDKQEALNALSDAIKRGYTDEVRLQNDSLFNSIRNSQEFVKLMESINK